jgi:hypothetical protein
MAQKFKKWLLFSLRTNLTCHQKPNPSSETVPLKRASFGISGVLGRNVQKSKVNKKNLLKNPQLRDNTNMTTCQGHY